MGHAIAQRNSLEGRHPDHERGVPHQGGHGFGHVATPGGTSMAHHIKQAIAVASVIALVSMTVALVVVLVVFILVVAPGGRL